MSSYVVGQKIIGNSKNTYTLTKTGTICTVRAIVIDGSPDTNLDENHDCYWMIDNLPYRGYALVSVDGCPEYSMFIVAEDSFDPLNGEHVKIEVL